MTDPSPRWTLVVHGGSGIIERGTLSPAAEAGARAGIAVVSALCAAPDPADAARSLLGAWNS